MAYAHKMVMENAAMSHYYSSLSLSNINYKKTHQNTLFFSFKFNEPSSYKFHAKRLLLLQPQSSSSHFSHIVRVSSSSSGAEFPGQYLDEEAKEMKKMKKRKRIAGIDQDELVDDPTRLADSDSCFSEFRGVKLHHKICDPELLKNDESFLSSGSTQSVAIGLPMILLHGFGASLFSWNRVMKGLALIVGSKVLAFDRPAFGLTSRLDLGSSLENGANKKLNPYSMAFSVLATCHFIELLGAEKAILVGHSAGSFVAVNSYFEAPERVAALILVAPAILAPLVVQKESNNRKNGDDNQTRDHSSSSNDNLLVMFAKFIVLAVNRLMKGLVDLVSSLYRKFLKFFLQSSFAVALIRVIIDKFGIFAVKNSWYNSDLCTEQVVAGYTKPLRVKGWDRALVEYTSALLTDTAPESKPPLSKRLSEISCPVLIITGDSDRIVPAWNAERLARAIPGSCFEVIKQCGHLPHEEQVDEFLSVVQRFLQRTLGDSRPYSDACS